MANWSCSSNSSRNPTEAKQKLSTHKIATKKSPVNWAPFSVCVCVCGGGAWQLHTVCNWWLIFDGCCCFAFLFEATNSNSNNCYCCCCWYCCCDLVSDNAFLQLHSPQLCACVYIYYLLSLSLCVSYECCINKYTQNSPAQRTGRCFSSSSLSQ